MNNAAKAHEQTILQTLSSSQVQEPNAGIQGSEANLAQAVGKMVSLKEEHRPIMEQIARDPGMLPETRLALVDHVLEEEEELVAKISALVGGTSASGSEQPRGHSPRISAEGATEARSGGLTVGSMRILPQEDTQVKSVGSLKRENLSW